LDFLEADTFQYYQKNPSALRERIAASLDINLVIIDEVQKVPMLLDEIHKLIETYPHISFILCGSSARRLKSLGANLLGGRARRFMFFPLCYAETQELNWPKIFNHGLIPSHYMAHRNVERSLAAYVYDYINTEVQLEANLRNRNTFLRFLEIIGLCNGEMINYSNIARDCGVDAKTVQTYFAILEDMYLVHSEKPSKGSKDMA
jgi:predicted AAA+ superfamily ATPase